MFLLTDTEKLLLVRQLRRAKQEVVRAKMMLAGAVDGAEAGMVDELADMADDLANHIDAIVKLEIVPNDDEEEGEK